MTPADEATFIALWPQGLEIAAIAQRLGIPKGTVRSTGASPAAARADPAPARVVGPTRVSGRWRGRGAAREGGVSPDTRGASRDTQGA